MSRDLWRELFLALHAELTTADVLSLGPKRIGIAPPGDTSELYLIDEDVDPDPEARGWYVVTDSDDVLGVWPPSHDSIRGILAALQSSASPWAPGPMPAPQPSRSTGEATLFGDPEAA